MGEQKQNSKLVGRTKSAVAGVDTRAQQKKLGNSEVFQLLHYLVMQRKEDSPADQIAGLVRDVEYYPGISQVELLGLATQVAANIKQADKW